MSTVLTVAVKGVSESELDKNFQILDSYMNQQSEFELVSSAYFNPRIYYSRKTLTAKTIHGVINVLKTDKTISRVVRGIAYSQNLNKM